MTVLQSFQLSRILHESHAFRSQLMLTVYFSRKIKNERKILNNCPASLGTSQRSFKSWNKTTAAVQIQLRTHALCPRAVKCNAAAVKYTCEFNTWTLHLEHFNRLAMPDSEEDFSNTEQLSVPSPKSPKLDHEQQRRSVKKFAGEAGYKSSFQACW